MGKQVVVMLGVFCMRLPQGESQLALPRLQGCNDSGREQLVAALPAQLDAQGWHVQQASQGESAAEWVEQQGCQ
ncbi:hypothetical protein HaLaN_27968, partial [Haematococcus lacustris]